MRCAVRPTESADKKAALEGGFFFVFGPPAMAAMAGALRDL